MNISSASTINATLSPLIYPKYQIGDLVAVRFNFYEDGTPVDYIPTYISVITSNTQNKIWANSEETEIAYEAYVLYMILDNKIVEEKEGMCKWIHYIQEKEIKGLLSR